jgi:hypothetical protein
MVLKDIRPEVLSRDSSTSSPFDRGPILRVEQGLALQPERDGLLLDSPEPKLADLGGERLLGTASNRDGPLESGNVVFLRGFLHHKDDNTTRNLVDVNKRSCFTDTRETCTVLNMPHANKKPMTPPLLRQAKRKRKPEPQVGPDGYTLAQRVAQLLVQKGIGQTDLARMCSQYYAALVPGAEPDMVKQQHIFNILQGQDTAWAVPLIAEVCEVSLMWLQYGIGKREVDRQ